MYSHYLDSTEIQLLHTTENHNKTEPTELRQTKLHYFFIFSKKKINFIYVSQFEELIIYDRKFLSLKIATGKLFE